MAEVATGVLHNVGNGLNAVNVSAALLAERLVPKTADRVERLADLLDKESVEHEETKAAGMYARRLSESARQEQTVMRVELDRLREGLDHVKAIVQAQQGYARSAGHVSPVSLEEAVEQTLSLVQSSIRNHGIEVHVDMQSLPPMVLDRHKLVQVLTNLVGNARDAVRDVPRKGQISVVCRELSGEVVIEVSDNGVGIAPDVRSRVFGHGFTTKKTGHGFGLHVSALSAADLGGRLEVESDGVDQGATFRLVLEDPCWGARPVLGQPG
jgi:C4-dicarboxylate-specific signal transduction histidine kinase